MNGEDPVDPTAAPGWWSPAEADAEALRRALLESRVDTEADSPGVTAYVGDLARFVVEQLAELLQSGVDRAGGWLSWLRWIDARWLAYGMLALLLAVLLWITYRLWPARRRPDLAPAEEGVAESGQRSAPADWLERLERSLEQGHVGQALEALWWWLAERLTTGADASWTSRELIDRSERPDLLSPIRRFERMRYGVARPRIEDVRRLWRELRGAVS